jgi:hypothetical protein
MFHPSFLIICILLIGLGTNAETLKSLAQKSTLLLTIADNEAFQKKCSINSERVSMLSQKLKIQIDQKIDRLTENDFKILNHRAETCQNDCSCNIYSLAFEAKNKKNEIMTEKASKETTADRQKCISKIKNICSLVQKI